MVQDCGDQRIIQNGDGTVTIVTTTPMNPDPFTDLIGDDLFNGTQALHKFSAGGPTSLQPSVTPWPGEYMFGMKFERMSQQAKTKSWDVSAIIICHIHVRSVPGSLPPLVLACVDVEGKLNLEERRGKYRLRSCASTSFMPGTHRCLVSCQRRPVSGPKGCQATLPQISCKSVQPVPARVVEPFSLVRQSSSGGIMSNLIFSNMPLP